MIYRFVFMVVVVVLGTAGCRTAGEYSTSGPEASGQADPRFEFDLTWGERPGDLKLFPGAVLLTTSPRWNAIIPVFLNGKGPFNFLVDTGAERTLVSSAIARPNGQARAAVTAGIGGTQQVAIADLDTLAIGRLTIRKLAVSVGTFNFSDPKLGPVYGLLGQDILSNFRVTLDYPKRKLILEDTRRITKVRPEK